MKESTIRLAHGGGGGLSRQLIETEIIPRFGEGPLRQLPDAAVLPPTDGAMVFTTDSFVVQPLDFPGGNIGDLAVHGTVNDIAACGGVPLWLSMGLILEEGLSLETLRRALDAVKSAAEACGVVVVTGDTKVVGSGQCDGMYINTSGIGRRLNGYELSTDRIGEGDYVLVSGPIGDHGMAVLSVRKGIEIAGGPLSDSAPVHRLVQSAGAWAKAVHFMRDPTRGGLAAVLNEAVEGRALDIELTENDIPVSPGTRAVAEMLGLDPLHSASEGRIVAVCAAHAAVRVLSAWRELPEGRTATGIGLVRSGEGRVIMRTLTGGKRLVDVPRGELLPRIC